MASESLQRALFDWESGQGKSESECERSMAELSSCACQRDGLFNTQRSHCSGKEVTQIGHCV